MHPKQPRVLALRNKVRAAHIGRQHRFFNQLVRHIAGARHDLFNAAVLVAHDLRLGGLKVHRATALARLEQRLVHTVQIEQIPHQGFAFLRFRSPRIAEDGRDLVVGESRMAPHHRRIELVGADLAIKRHEHIAHHAQALYLRLQRAQTVGEFFGQHGNDPARKVDAGGPVVGVNVNGRTVFHIVADIRNGHQQAPAFDRRLTTALGGGLAIHRVVKVACVFPVYGDQRDVG